jgi:hypothetical protein
VSEQSRLRDASGAARWARILVLANAVLVAPTAYVWGLDSVGPTLSLVVFSLAFVSYLAAAAVSLRWLYLANFNARALGATDLEGSPALAVGWFFIPLANLVMPYLTLRDTWRASVRPRDWQAVRAPVPVALWWTCWLIAGFSGRIAMLIEYRSGFPLEREPWVVQLDLVSTLFWAIAAWFFAWMIGRIQEAQADPAHLRDHFS